MEDTATRRVSGGNLKPGDDAMSRYLRNFQDADNKHEHEKNGTHPAASPASPPTSRGGGLADAAKLRYLQSLAKDAAGLSAVPHKKDSDDSDSAPLPEKVVKSQETVNAFNAFLRQRKIVSVDHVLAEVAAHKSTSINLNNSREMRTKGDKEVTELVRRIGEASRANPQATSLSMTNCNLNNHGAAEVARFLTTNATITELNLSSNSISSAGVESIARMLERNATLRILRLHNQSFVSTHEARQALLGALEKNRTLLNVGFDFVIPRMTEFKQKFLMRNQELRRLERQQRLQREGSVTSSSASTSASVSASASPAQTSSTVAQIMKAPVIVSPPSDDIMMRRNNTPVSPRSAIGYPLSPKGSPRGSPKAKVLSSPRTKQPQPSATPIAPASSTDFQDPRSTEALDDLSKEIDELRKKNEQLQKLIEANLQLQSRLDGHENKRERPSNERCTITFHNSSSDGDVAVKKILPIHKLNETFLKRKFELSEDIDCLLDVDTEDEHYDDVDGKFSTLLPDKTYRLLVFKPLKRPSPSPSASTSENSNPKKQPPPLPPKKVTVVAPQASPSPSTSALKSKPRSSSGTVKLTPKKPDTAKPKPKQVASSSSREKANSLSMSKTMPRPRSRKKRSSGKTFITPSPPTQPKPRSSQHGRTSGSAAGGPSLSHSDSASASSSSSSSSPLSSMTVPAKALHKREESTNGGDSSTRERRLSKRRHSAAEADTPAASVSSSTSVVAGQLSPSVEPLSQKENECHISESDIYVGSILARAAYIEDESEVVAEVEKANEGGKLGITGLQVASLAEIRYIVAISSSSIWIAFSGTTSFLDVMSHFERSPGSAAKAAKAGGLAQLLLVDASMDRFVDEAHRSSRRLVFVGHSIGGSLAHNYCLKYLNVEIPPDVCSLAFGTPFTATPRTMQRITRAGLGGRFCTVVNQNDGVPSLVDVAQRALSVADGRTAREIVSSVVKLMGLLSTVYGKEGNTSPEVVGQHLVELRRLQMSLFEMINKALQPKRGLFSIGRPSVVTLHRSASARSQSMAIVPEDPADGYLPFAPVGFYFLVSFYKNTWITQHTKSTDDVLKHFSESSYLDEKNFLYHSITDYVEVLNTPTVLTKVEQVGAVKFSVLSAYTPSVRHVSVLEDKADNGGGDQQKEGDTDDDTNLRIRVEGANLDFILRSKMISSSADDALDWDHAHVQKAHSKGGSVILSIPKLPVAPRGFILEQKLQGAQIFLHSDFGTAAADINEQMNTVGRHSAILTTMGKAFRSLLRLVQDNTPGKQGWQFVNSDKDIHTYSREVPGSTDACFKGVCTSIHASPIALMRLLSVPEDRGDWDPMWSESSLVERVNETTSVHRVVFNFGGMLSKRDFCVVMQVRGDEKTDSQYLVLRSIEHDNCPIVKGFTRGHIHLLGYHIEKADDKNERRSNCIVITHVDVMGMAFEYQKIASSRKFIDTLLDVRNQFPS